MSKKLTATLFELPPLKKLKIVINNVVNENISSKNLTNMNVKNKNWFYCGVFFCVCGNVNINRDVNINRGI